MLEHSENRRPEIRPRSRLCGRLLIDVGRAVVLTIILFIAGYALPIFGYGENWDKLRQTMRTLQVKPALFEDWAQTLQKWRNAPSEQQLNAINQFFNRQLLYDDDIAIWGLSDYWATPLQSLAKGKADCEDFVIAKYFSLRSMGISDQQLRLVYVRAKIGGERSQLSQAHMVLAYYPDQLAEPLILDNLISEIRPASRRPDLQPVFSFNAQGVFAGAGASASVGPGGTARLSRWQELLERARQEGFEFN